MAKKLLMNNNVGEDVIILCKNYSPNGQPFYLWQDKMIDWDKYELYINVDLNNVPNDKFREILITSNDGDTSTFYGNKLHLYVIDNRIRIQHGNFTGSIDVLVSDKGLVEVILNKDGFFINNKISNNNTSIVELWFNMIKSREEITIGNTNPNNLSVCTYNLVQLQLYQERGK